MLYYYPNRPLLFAPDSPQVQEFSESPDWDAEIKKNGDRLVLQKTSSFTFFNRHKKRLSYTPSPELLDELNALNLPKDSQLDGELMHFKTHRIKHLIILYDLYVLGGKKILEPLEIRRKRLRELVRDNTAHIQISQVFESDFSALFERVIEEDENEGLVMKNKKGKIKFNVVRSVDVA